MTITLVLVVFSALFATFTALQAPLVSLLLFIIFIVLLIFLKKLPFSVICFLVLVFIIYYVNGIYHESLRVSNFTGQEKTFLVKIDRKIIYDGPSVRTEVKDVKRNEKLVLNMYFKTKESKENFQKVFQQQQLCQVTGKLKEPSRARNVNGFDYSNYLFQNKVHWVLTVNNIQLTKCTELKQTPILKLKQLRHRGLTKIESNYGGHSAPLVAALVFGERSLMDENVLSRYQKLGISHLLAISGLHVGLICGMVYYLALRVGIRREIVMLTMLLTLPCYVILTGAAPSVIRAVVMIWLVVAVQLLSKSKLKAIHSICFAFLLFVLLEPYSIFHPGFQLSFTVSFALIISSETIMKQYKYTVSKLFIISFISQVASTPILLYHFYEISVISLVMNIVYVPLFSFVILPVVLLTFIVSTISSKISYPLIIVVNKLIEVLNLLTDYFSQFPYATLVIGKPHHLLIIVYFIVILFFFYKLERGATLYKKFIGTIPFVIVVILQLMSNQYSPFGEITFIDVGQGDSIFIKLPYNKGNFLIDTGGLVTFGEDEWQLKKTAFDPGKDIIAPFLKSKGITRLDKIIITHGHMDHIGGAFYIVNNLKVRELVIPNISERVQLEIDLIKEAKQNRTKIKLVNNGMEWKTKDSFFKVVSPDEIIAKSSNLNNHSIVLYTKIGRLSWLFTGDLEEDGEINLLKNYPNLTVDVLKVGHHGSNTSSTTKFLKMLKPRYGIISAGVNNRFNHPHPEVIERLEAENIKIYRTDLDGGVTYMFFHNKRGTFEKVIP